MPGILMMGAAALGIVFANSALSELYGQFLTMPVEVKVGTAELAKPLLLWVNDGLMAVFFLFVALELKREVLEGALSKPGQMALPLAASIGGIVVPAGIYAALNASNAEALRGWAIPAATDIAFALGVLALLGDRVPSALKTFLLSLAVFDDLGAIVIIAAFYTEEISWLAKGLALLASAILLLMNRSGVVRTGPYLFIGMLLWVCVLKSGVHATLAGVVVGLMIPHRTPERSSVSPLLDLEHSLKPWVVYMIVPLFAFANAGVRLAGMGSQILDTVALGILGGLVVGKVVGVFGASYLLVRFGRAGLPEGASWSSLLGVSALAGIGFTMSLFVGTLAFEHATQDYSVPLRVGVLLGSLVSAVIGYLILARTTKGVAREA